MTSGEESRDLVPKNLRMNDPIRPGDIFEGKDIADRILTAVPEVSGMSSDTADLFLKDTVVEAAKESFYNGRQRQYPLR